MIDLTELVSKVNGSINPIGCSSRDSEVIKNIDNLGKMLCNYVDALNMIKYQNETAYEGSVIKCRDRAVYYLDEIKEIIGDGE